MIRRVPLGAAALVLLLAGCQPVDSTASDPGAKPVDAALTLRLTATRSAKVDTYSADLDEQGTADGRDTQVTASLRYRRSPDPAVGADFTELKVRGAETHDAHAVLLDGRLYLNVPVVSPLLAGGHPWLRISLTGLERMTGMDAARVVGNLLENGPATLSRMFAASTDVSSEGGETVDGVSTTHLRGTVTLTTALNRLNGEDRTRAENLYSSSGTISFDLWSDSAHLPRKAEFKVTGTNTPTSTTVHFHYGKAVRIVAPPADQVGGLLSLGA